MNDALRSPHSAPWGGLSTGATVFNWTLLSRAKVGPRSAFVCVCTCGTFRIVLTQSLKSGCSTGCGCTGTIRGAAKRTRHGHARKDGWSKEYTAWNSIIQRCTNPSSQSYANYGARGISVSPRWLIFENFLADMGAAPRSDLSLDRINNDGNYEPTNCRWATRKQQNANKRGAGVRDSKGQFIGTKPSGEKQ